MDINRFIINFSKKGYSQQTVRVQLGVLNQIFNYAILQGEATTNPTISVKVPKGLSKTKRELPSTQDIEIVKNSLQADFGLFAYFLLYTGCRRGEALAVKYEDIDFENQIITINKSVFYTSNQPYIKTPKTGSWPKGNYFTQQISIRLAEK